jgi:hypothetical protein
MRIRLSGIIHLLEANAIPMKKKVSNAIAWSNHIGLIFAVPLVSIIVAAIWWWPGLATSNLSNPSSLYLLSTISQSLAAVFALVFTIALVVAQLSSRYSHRIFGRFFNSWVIGYMLLFIVTILLPLWLLPAPSPKSIKLSLTLAAISLILVIPYLLSFKERLSPDMMLRDLGHRASAKLQGTYETPDEVVAIGNIVTSAFSMKDYETFAEGVKTLGRIAFEAYEKGNQQLGDLILAKLLQIGRTSLDDPTAPVYVSATLLSFADRAISKNLDAFVGKTVNTLRDIGTSAARKKLEEIAAIVIENLGGLGETAAKAGLKTAMTELASALEEFGMIAVEEIPDRWLGIQVCWAFGKFGTGAAENQRDDVVNKIIYTLHKIGVRASNNDQEDIARNVALALSEIGHKAAEVGSNEVVRSTVRALETVQRMAARKGQKLLEGNIEFLLDGLSQTFSARSNGTSKS